MTSVGNAPMGADLDPNAPWNQSEPEYKEIEVTISLTISKTTKIFVPDIKLDSSDLKEAVKEQLVLPHEVEYIKPFLKNRSSLGKKVIEDLSKEVDAVIVVGGKNSSNTKKLYDISIKNCNLVFHIERISELNKNDFDNCNKVAIVAGASTPKNIIEEVKEYFEK